MRTFLFLLTSIALQLLLPAQSSAETSKLNLEGAVAEVYKHASGDDLWIYRFDPPGEYADKKNRPAVVFFFGGGWNSGTPTQFVPHCQYLAARGVVSFVADYRVKSRQKTAPNACVADGKSAVRWIRKNAARLGIDPNKIIAGGGSAGGHVAAATGICDGFDEETGDELAVSSKPNGLLLFNPVYDNGPENGFGHSRITKWFPAISPAHNISEDDPPAVVFLGTKDKLIPVSVAEKFRDAMKSAGIYSELHTYEGEPHGFFNYSRNPDHFADTIAKTDRFLVEIGILSGEANSKKIEELTAAAAKAASGNRRKGKKQDQPK